MMIVVAELHNVLELGSADRLSVLLEKHVRGHFTYMTYMISQREQVCL